MQVEESPVWTNAGTSCLVYLMSLNFNKSVADPNLYYNTVGVECLIFGSI
jgi:hypothetical protein